mmetsp:Transcript_39567/g.118748  ORF Transcript_39567/g.118748 Transcript_39567/m.118748 type:complete len:124 (+) Transcript_39567:216-587(+)
MKLSNLAVLAAVAPLTTSFTPTTLFNQRRLVSSSASSSSSSLPMVIVPVPTITISQIQTVDATLLASSTQSPSALKDAEKKLLKEVKAAEEEEKRDAKAAKLEERRKVFFEYEARRAEEEEAR